jgi:hypothetical protein
MCRPLKQILGTLGGEKKKRKKKKNVGGDLVCENPNNFNLKTPQKHYINLKKLILNLKIACD